MQKNVHSIPYLVTVLVFFSIIGIIAIHNLEIFDSQFNVDNKENRFSGFATVAPEMRDSSKDESMYEASMLFIASDRNWHDVITFIPVISWRQNTARTNFPLLLYHEQSPGVYDFDSIIHFVKDYNPSQIVIIGNINDVPRSLAELLTAPSPLGADFDEQNIHRVNAEDNLLFWDTYEQVIMIDDNYALGVISAPYASLLNIPLIIRGSTQDNINNIQGKQVICIGDLERQACDVYLTPQQVMQNYYELTETDKFILINPSDYYATKSGTIQPMRTVPVISGLYGKQSLAAPILAASKEELIIPVSSMTIEGIDAELKNVIQNLGVDVIVDYEEEPYYLTIIAADNKIPLKVGGYENIFDNPWQVSVDTTIFANFDDDNLPDMAVGRIFGLTTTDLSTVIARSVFYERIDYDAKMRFMGKSRDVAIDHAYRWSNRYDVAGYDSECSIVPGHFDSNPINPDYGSNYLCEQVVGPYFSSAHWVDKDLILYADHGNGGFSGIFWNEIPELDNSLVLSTGCSTCTELTRTSFCAWTLRKGAIGFKGAVYTQWTSDQTDFYLLQLFYNPGNYLGTLNHRSIGSILRTSIAWAYEDTDVRIMTLVNEYFGDPTVRIRAPYGVSGLNW